MSFRAHTAHQVINDCTPEQLRALLDTSASVELRGDDSARGDSLDDYLHRNESNADHFMRAERGDTGWRVLVGVDQRMTLTTTAPNTDATFDIMRSWANNDDWWLDAFDWQQVDRE